MLWGWTLHLSVETADPSYLICPATEAARVSCMADGVQAFRTAGRRGCSESLLFARLPPDDRVGDPVLAIEPAHHLARPGVVEGRVARA